MERHILRAMIFLFPFLGASNSLYAWENLLTHPALTDKAVTASVADDWLKTQLALDSGVQAQLNYADGFPAYLKEQMRHKDDPTRTTRTVLDWLKAGSLLEDEDGRLFPLRPRHHFHAPMANTGQGNANAGLENQTDHPNWKWYAPAFGTGFKFDFTVTGTITDIYDFIGSCNNDYDGYYARVQTCYAPSYGRVAGNIFRAQVNFNDNSEILPACEYDNSGCLYIHWLVGLGILEGPD